MIILSFNILNNLNDRFIYQLIVLSFGYSLMIEILDANNPLMKTNKACEILLKY